MALVLRRNKSAPLTYEEMDGNFEELEGSVSGILSESEVRALISVTDNGGDGALFYNSTTGVITYTGPSAADTRAHFSAGNGIGITNGIVSVTVDGINDTMLDFGTGANQINTDDLPEGSTNQYYTNARADARIALASIDVLADVDARPATQGDVLTYSSVDDGYIPVAPPGATGGEANDGFNTGTGAGIFKQKVGVDLEFKSLIAGNGIGITNNVSDLTINFLPSSDVDVNTQKLINVVDPTLAQDAATKAYVDSTVATADLDVVGDTGTGAIDLGSQVLTIAGTANEIETVASGQTITIGLPSAITADVTGDVTGNVSGTAATVTDAAQANITSVGTLTGLTMSGDILLGTNKITGLGDPVANQDAATKTYVDTIAAAGLHYHDAVRVEVEGNLTVTYDNGTDGVGATLTNAGAQTALVIDGVTMVAADRVLVYEQTDQSQNGVYTVTDIGSGSTNWVLTRATDADSYSASDKDALGEGDAFFVSEGTAGAGELYVMNATGAITFGTTNITFTQISSSQIYSASTGLDLTGTTFSLSHLGIESLADPDADKIAFWDDSAGAFEWLTIGTGLTLTGTELVASSAAYTAGDGITLTGVDFDIDLTDTTVFTSTDTASKAVVRDGSGDFAAGTITASLSGNASTATALETARNIGGVSFDGSASINLPGVNTAGNQDTSGNASTATALETSRSIGGVSFDGTANIDLPGVNTAGTQNTSGTAALATQVTVSESFNLNATSYIPFVGAETGSLDIITDASLSYNASTNTLTASNLSGNATSATLASTVNIVANNATDETVYLTHVDGATGTQGLESSTGLTFNPGTGTLTVEDIVDTPAINMAPLGVPTITMTDATTDTYSEGKYGRLIWNRQGPVSGTNIMSEISSSLEIDSSVNWGSRLQIEAKSAGTFNNHTIDMNTGGSLYISSGHGIMIGMNTNSRAAIADDAYTMFPDANNTYDLGKTGARWSTVFATTFDGTATTAEYADLAEIYTTDSEYSFGTVVKLGGDAEITQTTQCCDTQVFGVISENPAYLMNSTETGLPVALSGRIRVKLIGAVKKGQRIVSSATPGVAEAIDDADIGNVLAIIGRALESNDNADEKLVECVVGKL